MSGTVKQIASYSPTELKVCHLFIDLNRFRPSILQEDVVRLKNPLNMSHTTNTLRFFTSVQLLDFYQFQLSLGSP